MTSRLTLLLSLAFALICIGCGDVGTQSRRGGGLEIPNGIASSLVVRLTDSSGAPLGNTQVQVIAGESWAARIQAKRDVALDTVTTDSQGLARLDVTESRVFLLARSGNQGIHLALYPRDSAGHGRANPMPVPMRRLAHLDLQYSTQKNLAVFGTPWRFLGETPDGRYRLDSVPQGEYMPVQVDSAGLQMGQTIMTDAFDTLTDMASMVFSDPNNLMLENFQNRRLLGIWDPLHVGGYWWATASVNGVTSWDHFGMHRLSDLLDSSNGNIYAGVNVAFLDTGLTVANFGLDFSTKPVNTNLSKATAVSFFARGTGQWFVYVQTQDPNGLNPLQWSHPLTLSTDWHLYRIPLTEFKCETDSNQLWPATTRWGTNLFWQTFHDGQLRVDDIVFEGLRFEDWVDP